MTILASNIDFLLALKDDDILTERRIGTRNIISAKKQAVIKIGLNVCSPGERLFMPANISGRCGARHATVEYDGGRGRILGTPGSREWLGHISDVSGRYPRNPLAERFFNSPTTRCDNISGEMDGIYGDTVLITNVRRYWCINQCHTLTEESIDELDELLTTRRQLIGRNSYDRLILFLETPCEEDLVAIKLFLN